jgi:hypothetical protein
MSGLIGDVCWWRHSRYCLSWCRPGERGGKLGTKVLWYLWLVCCFVSLSSPSTLSDSTSWLIDSEVVWPLVAGLSLTSWSSMSMSISSALWTGAELTVAAGQLEPLSGLSSSISLWFFAAPIESSWTCPLVLDASWGAPPASLSCWTTAANLTWRWAENQ